MITEIQARKVLEVVDAGLVSGIGKPIPGQMCVEAAVCYALGLPHGDKPSCVAPALRALKIRLNDSQWSCNEARTAGMRRLALAQLGSAGALDENEFVRRIVDYAIRVTTPKALRISASLHKDAGHRNALLAAANKCEAEGTAAAAKAAAYTASAAETKALASACEATANAVYADATRAATNAAEAAEVDAAAANAAYAAATNATFAASAAADAAYASAADATRAAGDAAAANAAVARAASAADAERDKSLAEYAEAIVLILIDMRAPGCQWLHLTEF